MIGAARSESLLPVEPAMATESGFRESDAVPAHRSAAPVSDFLAEPQLGPLEPPPAFWSFVSNLAACISAPPRGVSPQAWTVSPMFRSAFLRRGDPSRGLLLSALLHVASVTAIVSAPLYDFGAAARLFQPADDLVVKHEVIYYSTADLLPLISPPQPKAPEKTAPTPSPSRVAVKLASQPSQRIASKPPAPDNRRQILMQPEFPELPEMAEVRVPNMIRWSAPRLPVPQVATKIQLPAPKPAPTPRAPVERVMPNLPMPKSLGADTAAIPVAPVSGVKAPRLPVPVRIARAVAPEPVKEQPVTQRAPELPATPDLAANAMQAVAPETIELASLIAISVAPAPPTVEPAIPRGSLSGEFSAAPEGSGEESDGIPSWSDAIATTARGDGELPAEEGAKIHVPSLAVTGGRASPSSTLGGIDPASDLRRLMASASLPKLSTRAGPGTVARTGPELGNGRKLESEFFGARRVYTVYMNMPNLTSAAGSWVLRFAEVNQRDAMQGGSDDLTTPEAIRKVDPMYVASAARERVQGTVTLAAVVLKDGTLADIRVVGSLDSRLDASAVAALTQWLFRPAQRNGSPVELEVLVQIPFRIPSL